MRHWFLCLLVLFTVAHADDNVLVRLPTQTELMPLYLSSVIRDDTEFDQEYLAKLDAVLRYDFEHNGVTQVLEKSSDLEALAAKSFSDPRPFFKQWREARAMYVVIPRVQANHMSMRLISLSNEVTKELSDIALSGDLAEDRRRIHQAADSIHFELFGKEGIASTRILFTKRIDSKNGTKESEVWEIDYDGSNARQITNEGAYIVTPTYVPPAPGKAARQFIYVTYRWGQPRIMYASLKDGEGQRLTNLRGNQLLPSVSPQRNKIAFISDITGNPDIFIQGFNPDNGPVGKPQQVYSAKGAVQGSPSFSPNGKQLAFVSDQAGRPQVYIMAIPEPGARLSDLKPLMISTRARNGSAPSWSPDGSKIAFTALSQGTRQIWVYDFNTNQDYQLTSGSGHKENPSWAPDSLHLIFNTADPGKADLYMIDLRQAKPVKITAGSGEKRFPSWEPR